MKASALEFRLRYLLHALVYGLGFWAPWNYWLHLDAPGPNAHVWGLLAVYLAKATGAGLDGMFVGLLLVGILFAAAGAGLRTWGSAYLGAGVVQDRKMHAGVVADGPYRFLRNPLYAGTMLHTVALALLMPLSGAVFTVAVIAVMQARLALGEEGFLWGKLGAAYKEYCARVPRWLPFGRLPGAGARPRWGQAVLGESYMIGVAGCFTVAGWRYNAQTLIQCVVVCLGLSLVARAFVGKAPSGAGVPAPGRNL